MSQVIIDLETLDTARTAAFISIGAVKVDFLTGKISDEFYANINFADAKDYGTTSKSTLDFWKKQPKEVKDMLQIDPQPLEKVMYDFACWFNTNDRAWGNGATFDVSILENYYESVNTNMPWKFWNIRDVRTIVEVGEFFFGFNKFDTIPFEGKQHYALDDAKHEAKMVSWVYQRIAKAKAAL